MLLLNCTGDETFKDCTVANSTFIYEGGFYSMVIVASLGCLFNALSLFIFIFSNNMETKFLLYLKYYLANSLIVTANVLIACVLFIALNGSIFGNQHKIFNYNLVSSLDYVTYYSYVFMPIWTLTYTYGSILDIMIAYQRILMYLPRIGFLRNLRINVCLLVILVVSCAINLPANLSRITYATILSFNDTR